MTIPMKKSLFIASLVVAATFNTVKADVFTVEKLNQLNQLHDVTVSPKGDSLIYGIKKGSFSTDDHLYSQNIKTGKVNQLTSHAKSEHNVVWADDAKSIYFLSSRSGNSQIWQLPLNGGEANQLSDLPIDINGFKLSKNGQVFALSLTVKPGCKDLACTVSAKKADKVKKFNIRAYDELMVRHWDEWSTEYKNHLFVSYRNEQGKIETAQDIMSDWASDIAGIGQVAIHPKGSSLVFSAKDSSTKTSRALLPL